MESMSKGSGPIMIPLLVMIMIVGMNVSSSIYRNSRNSISEAGSQIAQQEIISFNQQWNTYEGAQGGNNIKAVLQKLIANCNTNAQEEQRLVDVVCSRATEEDEKTEIIITSENVEESVREHQNHSETVSEYPGA